MTRPFPIEQFARLLSREKLTIHRKPIPTAAFDPRTRTLILPVWTHMAPDEEMLLVIHEVGHALFSPSNPRQHHLIIAEYPSGAPDSFYDVLNIVEDVRIDRLMIRNFPGSEPAIRSGYKTLEARNFFRGEEGVSYNDFPFVDRANLHFKLGEQGFIDHGISFTPEEEELLRRMTATRSFDEVVKVALDLYHRESSRTIDPSEKQPDPKAQVSSKKKQKQKRATKQKIVEVASGVSQKKFNTFLEQFTNTIKTPSEMLPTEADKATIPITKYQSDGGTGAWEPWSVLQPIVKMMYGEFIRRRTASEQTRANEHRRGVLDPRRFAVAQLRDDIFRRYMTTPTGTKHGMMIVVDHSGSMDETMSAVWRQLAVLTGFCRMARIPYKALLFSTRYSQPYLVEVLSHDLTMTETLTRLEAFSHSAIRKEYPMNTTPLLQVTRSLCAHAPAFRTAYDIEKLSVVFLTDGGATDGANLPIIWHEPQGRHRAFTINRDNSFNDGGFFTAADAVRNIVSFSSSFWYIYDEDKPPSFDGVRAFDHIATFARDDLEKDMTQCRSMLKTFVQTIA